MMFHDDILSRARIHSMMVALEEEVRKEMEEEASSPCPSKKPGIDLRDIYEQFLPVSCLLLNAASIALGLAADSTKNYGNPAFLVFCPLSIVVLFLFFRFLGFLPSKKQMARMLRRGKIGRMFAGLLVFLLVPSVVVNFMLSLSIVLTVLLHLFN